MNLKKIKIIAVLGIFLLSFISHFAYELFPNIIFSFIFPVNESIWEHMKIIFTSTLIYGIIDYLLLKKYKIGNPKDAGRGDWFRSFYSDTAVKHYKDRFGDDATRKIKKKGCSLPTNVLHF